ncbi:MAG: NTP transferase domain-containing protein [Mitsuokella sp.]
MQAIIMAAGKGSRIHHLTAGNPKSFLEIGGKKLIERNIDMLHAHGIDDITIVVGYRADAFRELLQDRRGIHFVYNPFYEMVNVIGSFFMARDALHDDFVYLHADTICEDPLFSALLSKEGAIVLPVDTKPTDEEAMKVRLAGEHIIQLAKSLPPDEAAGEFIGIAKFAKETIPALRCATEKLMEEQAFGEYFEAAVQKLLDAGDFEAQMLDTENRFWAEIDFEEDYRKASARLK